MLHTTFSIDSSHLRFTKNWKFFLENFNYCLLVVYVFRFWAQRKTYWFYYDVFVLFFRNHFFGLSFTKIYFTKFLIPFAAYHLLYFNFEFSAHFAKLSSSKHSRNKNHIGIAHSYWNISFAIHLYVDRCQAQSVFRLSVFRRKYTDDFFNIIRR